jgi:hypothetical protein
MLTNRKSTEKYQCCGAVYISSCSAEPTRIYGYDVYTSKIYTKYKKTKIERIICFRILRNHEIFSNL